MLAEAGGHADVVDAEEAAARERDIPRRLPGGRRVLGEHRGGPPARGLRKPACRLLAGSAGPAARRSRFLFQGLRRRGGDAAQGGGGDGVFRGWWAGPARGGAVTRGPIGARGERPRPRGPWSPAPSEGPAPGPEPPPPPRSRPLGPELPTLRRQRQRPGPGPFPVRHRGRRRGPGGRGGRGGERPPGACGPGASWKSGHSRREGPGVWAAPSASLGVRLRPLLPRGDPRTQAHPQTHP